MGSLWRAALVGLSLLLGCAPLPERSGPTVLSETDELSGVTPLQVRVARSTVYLRVDAEQSPLQLSSLEQWTRQAATMVGNYYGGTFPVEDLDLAILVEGNEAIVAGEHRDGRHIKIWLGRATTEHDLKHDWVMVHEMLHTGFPDLHKRHCWMQEGLSTYLEPIVRARAETLTEEDVWARFAASLRHGLPREPDRGLDHARRWGRTYWGGALFWLVADLRLRQRTDGRIGLQDAIVGIVAAGGNGRVDWSVERVIAILDRVTQTRVFSQLYREMGQSAGSVDLDTLFAELGVVVAPDGSVVLRDDAPSAHLRRAMILGPHGG